MTVLKTGVFMDAPKSKSWLPNSNRLSESGDILDFSFDQQNPMKRPTMN